MRTDSSQTPRKRCAIGPILREPAHANEDRIDSEKERTRTGGGNSGTRYPRQLGVLVNILHAVGVWIVSNPRQSVRENTFFRAVAEVLARYSVSRRVKVSEHTARSYFTYLPGGFIPGGRCELRRRLLEAWPDSRRCREGWILGFVGSLGLRGALYEVKVTRLLADAAVRLRENGEHVNSEFTYLIPRERLIAPVTRGPFVALVVCSIASDGDRGPELKAEWVVLQAIASIDLPVPVESDVERRFVQLLDDRGEPFIKPLVADEDGLRPDFILPRLKVVIELDGMPRNKAYMRRKRRSHERLRSSPRYARFRCVFYTVRDGDDFAELLRLLYEDPTDE